MKMDRVTSPSHRNAAKSDVFEYIERFHNERRRYSTLGYMSPVEFEEKAMLD